MAVETTDSAQVAAAEASPQTLVDVSVSGGRVRSIIGTMEVTAAQVTDDGDILRLARIPSNAVINSIELGSDALGASGGTANVGIYQTDGTEDDEDAYASAVTILQAGSALTRVENEARDIDNVGERVWQDAGDTSDPGGLKDICVTIAATMGTPAAGSVSWVIHYTID